MRLIKAIVILFFSICVSMTAFAESEFHDTANAVFKTSELKGKWIIVNYWAAWCGYCIREIPELNSFYKHNKNKNVLVFGVNYDALQMPELKLVADKINIKFPVLLEDPKQVWDLDDTNVLPVTYIISPKGKMVKKILGPSTEDSLNDALQELKKS